MPKAAIPKPLFLKGKEPKACCPPRPVQVTAIRYFHKYSKPVKAARAGIRTFVWRLAAPEHHLPEPNL